MFYVNKKPNEIGNYGNPISNYTNNKISLPDEFLDDYIETMGFASLTIEDDVVVAVAINQEAYDAYQESIPEPEPEPEPMTQAEIEETLLDQEYRLLLLEYGLEEEEPI